MLDVVWIKYLCCVPSHHRAIVGLLTLDFVHHILAEEELWSIRVFFFVTLHIYLFIVNCSVYFSKIQWNRGAVSCVLQKYLLASSRPGLTLKMPSTFKELITRLKYCSQQHHVNCYMWPAPFCLPKKHCNKLSSMFISTGGASNVQYIDAVGWTKLHKIIHTWYLLFWSFEPNYMQKNCNYSTPMIGLDPLDHSILT